MGAINFGFEMNETQERLREVEPWSPARKRANLRDAARGGNIRAISNASLDDFAYSSPSSTGVTSFSSRIDRREIPRPPVGEVNGVSSSSASTPTTLSVEPNGRKTPTSGKKKIRIKIEETENSEGSRIPLRKRLKRNLFSIVLLLLYCVYFAAVLIIHSKIQDRNYWCDGDGFMIVVTTLAAFMVFYFKVFKPLIGKRLYKFCLKPLFAQCNAIIKRCRLQYFIFGIFFGLIIAFLVYDSAGERSRLISLGGIAAILIFGFIFSAARKKIVWRHVVWSLSLQYIMGLGILKWKTGKSIFECLGSKTQTFLEFTDSGSGFVFGELSSEMGIFAFKVLTVVLFFSFCINILYYYGAMQWIVIKLGWLLRVTVGTTAGESVNAAANIFLGQTEAPLMIKLYLPKMTKSEIHAVMTGGFATIAGTVMAAYISFGISPVHLISASVMNAPAALGYSKLFYPEVEESQTNVRNIKSEKGTEANVLHAAIEGVSNAIPLAVNIAANLIAIVAFVAFVDAILNWSCLLLNFEDGVCTLSNIFGYVFMPLAFCMGVPWKDCYIVGQLIGTKVTINEFVAYLNLADYIGKKVLTKRAEIIATYALCGFSNISSIGTMLGGLGAMAPERKADMSRVVLRAMIAGNMVCFLTACVAGSLLSVETMPPASESSLGATTLAPLTSTTSSVSLSSVAAFPSNQTWTTTPFP